MDCLFCKIIAGEIPSNKVYEDDDVYAFHDINPEAPTHILVIPKKHIAKLSDMEKSDTEVVGKVMYRAQALAKELGISESGFRVAMNTGPDAQQTVFHIHLHLLGGRQFRWPPG